MVGLGSTYTIHLRLIGKRVVDFLIVVSIHSIELFSLAVMAEEALRAKYCRFKIGVLQGGGSISAKFSHKRGCPSPIIFARTDRPVNALQLCRCTVSHKETL